MCSLRMYSKKQVVFHDALLAQKTSSESHLDFQVQTRASQNCGPSSCGVSRTVLQAPKLTSTCMKWWGNLPGCSSGGRGWETAAVLWMESTEGLLHSFSDPLAPFLWCSTGLSTPALDKKDCFSSI